MAWQNVPDSREKQDDSQMAINRDMAKPSGLPLKVSLQSAIMAANVVAPIHGNTPSMEANTIPYPYVLN
jgi:hypothetical protein